METKMDEDLGLNKGRNDGFPLSAPVAPGEDWCEEIINLVEAVVTFETPNKASWGRGCVMMNNSGVQRKGWDWRCRSDSY